ncbi:MAG: hypothetical protein AAF478_06570 [Pseudomonadota bacterium]
MRTIEDTIRNAIEQAAANSPESRVSLYLQAREAIQNLPRDKSEAAMQQLHDAIKVIEAEFVEAEQSAAIGVHANTSTGPTIKAASTASNKRLVQRLIKTCIALVIPIAVAASGYLLYLQISEKEPIKELFGTETSSGIEKLFSVRSSKELALISGNSNGSEPVKITETSEPNEAISLEKSAAIYGKNPIAIHSGEFYLLRLNLQIRPIKPRATLKSGFAYIAAENSPPVFINVLYDAAVSSDFYQNNSKSHFFSAVASGDEILAAIKPSASKAVVRPYFSIANKEENGSLQLLSFEVEVLR